MTLIVVDEPINHHSDKNKSLYRFGKTIAICRKGTVRQAKRNGITYAVKIYLKKDLPGWKLPTSEIECLIFCVHPNIVDLMDWFETKVRLA